MIYKCEIIRDLLPLYIDDVASQGSRQMVEDHLVECAECREMLKRMQNDEAENVIAGEKEKVIAGQRKRFKRKSTIVGSVIAGIFMIPILVCLIVNLASGSGLDWFFIVLASLLVAASLSIVPLVVPENKGLWTIGSFTVSLLLLFGVCCMYTGGKWFFVVSTSVLFGLSVIFLPFVARSRTLSKYLGNCKGLLVMAADTILYAAMMLSIGMQTSNPDFYKVTTAVSVPFVLLAWAFFLIIRYAGRSKCVKAGSCIALGGTFLFFAETLVNLPLGLKSSLPIFNPLVWNYTTLDGNVKWTILLGSCVVGAILCTIGTVKGRKEK